jgi:hypothetical protein
MHTGKAGLGRLGRLALSLGLLLGLCTLATAGIQGATVHRAHAITVGNPKCGNLTVSPSTSGVTGGYTYNGNPVAPTSVTFALTWSGTPSNSGCQTNPADCSTAFGGCHSGYWLIGLWCNTLAETSTSNPEQYCDVQHGVVMTDNNAGPNDAPDNHGTSWNVCTTVRTLAQIDSATIPQCLADGSSNAPGWTENWPTGAATGSITTDVPESGSTTPFSPSGTGVDCPPSQAEVAQGAIPGTCVFAVEELDWYYYCVAAICLPDFGNVAYPYPNGENVDANNYFAALFSYKESSPAPLTVATGAGRPGPGSTFKLSGGGWGPAVGLSTANNSLQAQVCGLGGTASACSTNSTVALTEGAGGVLSGTGTLGSDVGSGCLTGKCFVKVSTNAPQIENGWTGTYSVNSKNIVVPPGYWTVASDGGIFTFGQRNFYGSTGAMRLNSPVVGMAATPDKLGYWLVAADGGLFAYGDAGYYGSTGNIHLNSPIVGMAVTPDAKGYWLVARDGGVFNFGDAGYYGSEGGHPIGGSIVGLAPTADGLGYWLAGSDGTVYRFGDAVAYGSKGGSALPSPVVDIAPSYDAKGYWLTTAAGGIYAFGDAPNDGSMAGHVLNKPIVGMVPTPDGNGYWLDATDGGIFSFGDATFLGSMGGKPLNQPMVGMAS